MWYYEKLIISGDFIEHYRYEKPIEEGYKKTNTIKSVGRACKASDEDKLENRKKVMQRARTTIRRLINSNIGHWQDNNNTFPPAKFFTVTYANNITDVKYSNQEFRKFIKRLNRYIGINLKYVTVIEFQKRGAIHYHVVFFNLPYVEKNTLARIWGHGFVKINKINNVDNVGAYVSKYMGKDLEENRLIGEKCYFSSRGLRKPKEIKKISQVRTILETNPVELRYEASFRNDYIGEVAYAQYRKLFERRF